MIIFQANNNWAIEQFCPVIAHYLFALAIVITIARFHRNSVEFDLAACGFMTISKYRLIAVQIATDTEVPNTLSIDMIECDESVTWFVCTVHLVFNRLRRPAMNSVLWSTIISCITMYDARLLKQMFDAHFIFRYYHSILSLHFPWTLTFYSWTIKL